MVNKYLINGYIKIMTSPIIEVMLAPVIAWQAIYSITTQTEVLQGVVLGTFCKCIFGQT